MTSQTDDDDETSWQKALRIDLILQRLFRYFPTGFLLSSCSLVNKIWNRETRKFIWDRRRCTALNKQNAFPCKFLKQLDGICGQMTENARVIPFNSLSLNLSENCSVDSVPTVPSDPNFYSNLHSMLKLKTLNVASYWINQADCQVHNLLQKRFWPEWV